MMIRPARVDDADAVGGLWLALVQYHLDLDEHMPVPAEDGAYRYAQRVRNSVYDDWTQTYVAVDGGEIVGYVMGMVIDLLPEMFRDEKAGMVGDIFVRQDKRRNGTGQALMEAMKNWFRLRGVSYYEWYVASANVAGIRFWEKTMRGEAVMIRMRADLNDE